MHYCVDVAVCIIVAVTLSPVLRAIMPSSVADCPPSSVKRYRITESHQMLQTTLVSAESLRVWVGICGECQVAPLL